MATASREERTENWMCLLISSERKTKGSIVSIPFYVNNCAHHDGLYRPLLIALISLSVLFRVAVTFLFLLAHLVFGRITSVRSLTTLDWLKYNLHSLWCGIRHEYLHLSRIVDLQKVEERELLVLLSDSIVG